MHYRSGGMLINVDPTGRRHITQGSIGHCKFTGGIWPFAQTAVYQTVYYSRLPVYHVCLFISIRLAFISLLVVFPSLSLIMH